MKDKSIELLAPAGSFQALVAAVESGADAVYLGGQQFSARASANNFSEEELIKGIRYAHIRDVKVYVTVNTLIAEDELSVALDYVGFLYREDVDAVILQDLGLAKKIHERYPDLDLHGSTQMTIHDAAGAIALKEMGFSRVVVARELTKEDIRSIVDEADIQVETFVHGALCVCWSGQCLMSSLIGGRSGNRGRCAQPCRKKYKRVTGGAVGKASFAISTRDLNTLEDLQEILDAGVSSLKIEGRMKNPEYVGITVENYRKALDGSLGKPGSEWMKEAEYELQASFNRDFTKGYILGSKGNELVSEERPDNRGIFLGRVISQKGNFLRIKLENGFVCDGDGIEIEGADGYSGVVISGMNVNARLGKMAKSGDTAEVYTGRTFEVGSKVRKTLDSALQKKANDEYIFENRRKIFLKGWIRLNVGELGTLRINDDRGNTAEVTTEEPISAAQKKAATLETLQPNLEKLGDTPFLFTEITGEIGEGCFMPVSVVNELRRAAISEMEEKRSQLHPLRKTDEVTTGREKATSLENVGISADVTESIDGIESTEREKNKIYFRVENIDQAEGVLDAGGTLLDIKWDAFLRTPAAERKNTLVELKTRGAQEIWAVLPNVVKKSESAFLADILLLNQEQLISGVVINGIGMLDLMEKKKIPFRVGSGLNTFNSTAAEVFKKGQGIQLSEELSLAQIKQLIRDFRDGNGSEDPFPIFEGKAYGRAVAMTMEYCPFVKDGCEKDCSILKGASLLDNTGRSFPLRRSLGHRVQLLNGSCLMMLKELGEMRKIGLSAAIVEFTEEINREVFDLAQAFLKADGEGKAEYPEWIQECLETGKIEYTKGHYYRGVI